MHSDAAVRLVPVAGPGSGRRGNCLGAAFPRALGISLDPESLRDTSWPDGARLRPRAARDGSVTTATIGTGCGSCPVVTKS